MLSSALRILDTSHLLAFAGMYCRSEKSLRPGPRRREHPSLKRSDPIDRIHEEEFLKIAAYHAPHLFAIIKYAETGRKKFLRCSFLDYNPSFLASTELMPRFCRLLLFSTLIFLKRTRRPRRTSICFLIRQCKTLRENETTMSLKVLMVRRVPATKCRKLDLISLIFFHDAVSILGS